MKLQYRNSLTGWMLAAALGLVPGAAVLADDETDDTDYKIEATLDAVSCDTTPPTVTVLGLTIDISSARFGDDEDDDGTDDSGSTAPTCADLVQGQEIRVRLVDDLAPLRALRVQGRGEHHSESHVRLEAPLQAVDTTAKTIQQFGLTIDASGAEMDGADDSDDDNVANTTLDLSQLVVGQFVETKLNADQLPALVARELEVKNFANQVEVEIVDKDGQEIDDSGTGTQTIQLEVRSKVTVKSAKNDTTNVHKTVTLHASAAGSFLMAGMPTGKAKITVTRSADGKNQKGRGRVTVVGNQTQTIQVKVK